MNYRRSKFNRVEYYNSYRTSIEIDYKISDVLGRNRDKCLFCENIRIINPQLFKGKSHAVSRIFESNIINFDECDSCNEKFSKWETHLGHFFNPIKCLTIPTIKKFKDHSIQFYNEQGTLFVKGPIKKLDKKRRLLHFEVSLPEINNFQIYCCLLKMALSIFPRKKIAEIQKAILLLSGDEISEKKSKDESFFILWGADPKLDGITRISLLENVRNESYPQYIAHIQYHRFFFQFVIPFVSSDELKAVTCNEIPINDLDYLEPEKRPNSPSFGVLEISQIQPKSKKNYTLAALDPDRFDREFSDYRQE